MKLLENWLKGKGLHDQVDFWDLHFGQTFLTDQQIQVFAGKPLHQIQQQSLTHFESIL